MTLRLQLADCRQALFEAAHAGDFNTLLDEATRAFHLMGEAIDVLASVDTRPKGGDSAQTEAPFTSGAVPEGETP